MNATIERYGMSSSALQEMLAQRAEIEKKIAELQSESRAEAIAKIRTLMAETGLTMADITGSAQKEPKEPKAKSAVAIKYRNAATGETWTGRGLKPRWLTTAIAGGASIESFLA